MSVYLHVYIYKYMLFTPYIVTQIIIDFFKNIDKIKMKQKTYHLK